MSDLVSSVMAEPFELATQRGRADCIRLVCADGACAIVSLHGAQVLSWITADGRERLFLSERADLSPDSAIRGGIPVIFPQFAARGPLARHGFARTSAWCFDGLDDDSTAARFSLRDDAATRARWPHAFGARLTVAAGATALEIALEITNTGDRPVDFTCALHAYLRVDDLARARLEGVAGATYIDSADGDAARREGDAPLEFEGEIDRIHVGSGGDKTLLDGNGALHITMHGFTDTVVWNPGAALSSGMGDLAPDAYRHFVCVEPARITHPVRLAPGGRWRGVQRLSVRASVQIPATDED